MSKARENLLKAIEEKTNAYQRLSVKDILDLSQALKNIYDMGSCWEFSENGISYSKGGLPTINRDTSGMVLYRDGEDTIVGFGG